MDREWVGSLYLGWPLKRLPTSRPLFLSAGGPKRAPSVPRFERFERNAVRRRCRRLDAVEGPVGQKAEQVDQRRLAKLLVKI
jgi:hypothetical protein